MIAGGWMVQDGLKSQRNSRGRDKWVGYHRSRFMIYAKEGGLSKKGNEVFRFLFNTMYV
jgi:hypothetical protein